MPVLGGTYTAVTETIVNCRDAVKWFTVKVDVWQEMWRTPSSTVLTASSVIDELSHVSVRIMAKRFLSLHFHVPILARAHPFCSAGSKCWGRKCKDGAGFCGGLAFSSDVSPPRQPCSAYRPPKMSVSVASQCSRSQTGHLPFHCWICKPRQSCCCWRNKICPSSHKPHLLSSKKKNWTFGCP